MSERIYAHLLRLFPSAFRKHYEEESLRLLRDRLSDERGFFCRLRLSFDLIVDIIGALPQAYRNSYADVAPAASLTSYFDGVPSFRVLQKEPIRSGTIVIAGILSVTALSTVTYVMGRPTPFYPAARNGPLSPIESVMEGLNQPISPDPADGAHAGAPGLASVASAASQPAQVGEQTPDANTSELKWSRAVAVAPSRAPESQLFVQSQPETIRNVTRSINLSGKWTASLQAVGGDAEIRQEFIFRQDSAGLTGTGGSGSIQQYPIIHGLVAGDSVGFELNDGRRRFLYDLKVEGKELRGTVSIRSVNEVRTATVWLERAH